jgi:hypothetical protein
MTAAPEAPAGILLARCNPYGHSTGRGGDRGPRHLGGGLWGPEYEGRQKWTCTSLADGRYRMTCRCGHVGQVMPLCYQHVAMISKRQAGICPPCVMPPAALELHERIQRAQGHAATLAMLGADPAAVAAAVAQAEGLGAMMTDLVTRGIAHRCPLTLTEVS